MSGNPLISMRNADSRTGAIIDIKTTTTFTTHIRIHGYQMVKDTYMTLKLRVCGEESVRLQNAVKKFFLMGQARGDANSMSDSTRYYTIS